MRHGYGRSSLYINIKHAYNHFFSNLLVDQITVIWKEMCVYANVWSHIIHI